MLSSRLRQTWTVSFLFWTVYALLDSAGSFAILISVGDRPVPRNVILWNFAEAYMWVLFTPLLYTLGIKFEFTRDSWKRSLAAHIVASVVTSTVAAWLLIHMNMLLGAADTSTPFRTRLIGLGLQDLPRYFVTLAIAQIVVYYVALRERESQSARLEASLARAKIENLRRQLEPHFLFNALNSIATLTTSEPESAERMTLQLAALLRTSLEAGDAQLVSLKQELDFLHNYLEIQKTRFEKRLTVRINVDPDLLQTLVPSLILQPLVENAIQHGIAKSAAPSLLEITGHKYNGAIRLEIRNTASAMSDSLETSGNGVGLRNTRARLAQIYNGRSQLQIEKLPDGGCCATLLIPVPACASEKINDAN